MGLTTLGGSKRHKEDGLHTVDIVVCKIQIGFTFLVPAHPVVQEKGPLKGAAAIQRLAAITAATILFSATETANCQHFLQIFNLQLADQHDYKTKI